MIYERRFAWVEYPATDPGSIVAEWSDQHVGFRARVLVNPSGAEVRHETSLYAASNGTDLDAQDAYWQGVAWRVPDWNLAVRQDDGSILDVPAPAARWESFLDLDFGLAMWLRDCIHWAHRGKALTALQGNAGTTDSTPSTPPSPQS